VVFVSSCPASDRNQKNRDGSCKKKFQDWFHVHNFEIFAIRKIGPDGGGKESTGKKNEDGVDRDQEKTQQVDSDIHFSENQVFFAPTQLKILSCFQNCTKISQGGNLFK